MPMISAFDSADKAVDKTIVNLCTKLEVTTPGSPEYMQIVEAISKLRASQNSPIIQQVAE